MIHISRKETGKDVLRTPVLESACDRVQMTRYIVKAGTAWQPDLYSRPQVTQMILFLGGKGYVTTETRAFNITEPALFVPEFDKEAVTVKAVGEDLECLQIVSRMNEEDCNQINKSHMVFPKFKPFSEAWENTMNTIDAPDSNMRAFVLIENRKLGANNMGIFCSAGPGSSRTLEDKLPAYDHFVIALDGADYLLTAGGETVEIKAGDAAYIPKQTPFAFSCKENGKIHHVWYSLNRAYDNQEEV